MKFIFVFFIALFLFSEQVPRKENFTYYNDLKIIENPEKSTATIIPKAFIPENAKLLKFFELDIFSTEGGLFFLTQNDFNKLEKFYEDSFNQNDWKVFRKDKSDSILLFQVENGSKRIYSILVKKENSDFKVKIFYKRAR